MPPVFWANAVSAAPNIVATVNVAAEDSEFRFLGENFVIMFVISFVSSLSQKGSFVRLRRDVARLTTQERRPCGRLLVSGARTMQAGSGR
jgi:hypothetical protein